MRLRTRDLAFVPSAQRCQELRRPLVDGLQDDAAPLTTHDNLRRTFGKAERLRQTDGLTAAVLEELCSHLVYISQYIHLHKATR